MQISLALFNHVLGQHPAARAALAEHAGRRLALVLGPLNLSGVLTDDGWLAESDGEPEATLRVRTLALWQAQWSGRTPGFNDLDLAGDMALAQSVAQALGPVRWEPVEDLSRVLGDSVAHRIGQGVAALTGMQGQMARRVMVSALEHVRDEAPLLARKQDVERSLRAVDALRDDCERLEKRLERLEAVYRHQP